MIAQRRPMTPSFWIRPCDRVRVRSFSKDAQLPCCDLLLDDLCKNHSLDMLYDPQREPYTSHIHQHSWDSCGHVSGDVELLIGIVFALELA